MANHNENKSPSEQRSHRLKAGGVGVALSLVIVFFLEQTLFNGKDGAIPDYIIVAIASLVGSVTTGVTICFWDIHDLLLDVLKRKDK